MSRQKNPFDMGEQKFNNGTVDEKNTSYFCVCIQLPVEIYVDIYIILFYAILYICMTVRSLNTTADYFKKQNEGFVFTEKKN